MHVTFRQLKVFESVARHLNFTRAAEELHLTQPAVSMQIKQLEQSVELPLFEHMGKKVFLTEAGNEMYHYSRSIAQLLDEADEVFEELKGMHRGHLAISVASTANYFATRLLAAFSKRFENITFSLDVTNRKTLMNQLDANEKDLVIMGKPPENMDLLVEPFMENPLVVIAPPSHPLVGKAGIPLISLQKESFVVREQGSGTRIAMERFFAEHKVSLTTGMEMSSNEAIKQAVEAGLGLGIVSIHTMELELELGRLAVLNIESFPILRYWYVVHRQGKRLSPVARAFRQFVLDEASSLVRLSSQIV
ncbi:MAG: LysR family transcriptional regulator [Gammaproteobacteria bacterium]|nr:LysR family transcriptional regulator [Gammaproteobacteria bacterium]